MSKTKSPSLGNKCLAAAYSFLEDEGWNSVALCEPSHVGCGLQHRRLCHSPGKVPLEGTWKHYQSHQATRRDIEHAWYLWPNANVGVVCGRISGGLVAVDIDTPSPPAGLELPNTKYFKTGRGYRYLYRADSDKLVLTKQIFGVEVKGENSLTVMPPSLHHSGVRYRWLRRTTPLAQVPKWILTHCCNPSASRVTFSTTTDNNDTKLRKGDVQRGVYLFKMACAMRRYNALMPEIAAALREVNKRCEPPLPESRLLSIARSAARYKPEVFC